jgi:hypothetical protein
MIKQMIRDFIKNHIVDTLPPDEDMESSEKYR